MLIRSDGVILRREVCSMYQGLVFKAVLFLLVLVPPNDWPDGPSAGASVDMRPERAI